MSDTLADLASCLPSQFLTADDHMTHSDNKPFFLPFPTDVPYDFSSSSSAESESDDDDFTGLTRRFTRSLSLQDRLKNPYPLQRVFSGSPESTMNWTLSGPTQTRSFPTTPFARTEDDTWDLIYAAAGQVARMKMGMSNVNDDVFANRGLLGAPRPPGPPLFHHHHHHPNCAIWRGENEELIWQHQFRQRVAGGSCRSGSGPPMAVHQPPAWPPLPVENQRRQQPPNMFVDKPLLAGSGGGCGRVNSVAKKECAGTGVFIPRRYCHDPPESKKIPACSPAHLPARVAQSFNKNMDSIIAQARPNIHGGFAPHYETGMTRRNMTKIGQQRRSGGHVGVGVAGHPEVVLPQEWTY